MALLIEDYLQVIENLTFSDKTILRAIGSNGIEPGTSAFDVPERERDLAMAMMYEAAGSLVNGGGSRKQIGDRSISAGNIQTSKQDRASFMAIANSLRVKWGVKTVEATTPEISDQSLLW